MSTDDAPSISQAVITLDPDDIKCLATSSEILKKDLELSYCRDLNIREVTIAEVHSALESHRITASELTSLYIKRIEALNPYLNAVIEINPDAVQIAKELDAEQKETGLRGPLHGVPILVKGNIGTNDNTETCAGSLALVGLKPKDDAKVVKRLRAAGAIILGKANLSEFANFRGEGIPSGWSGRGKQTKNPYVLGRDPSGSSSGSAVSVAANLCVVSLGSETDGSIVSPASCNCVVGLKPTVGNVPSTGVIPLAHSQDSVGPMARTVQDAALVYNVISNNPLKEKCFDLKDFDANKLLTSNLKVGVLRSVLWAPFHGVQFSECDKILTFLKISGLTIVDPVEAPNELVDNVSIDSELVTLYHEFKTGINEYLASAVCAVVGSNGLCNGIRCLTDIIEFNKQNPVPENYNQKELEAADATDGVINLNYINKQNANVKAARELIDDLVKRYDLDAIVAPTGGNSSFFAAVSGYPIISVPAGFEADGTPFGITFFGTANSEEKLLLISARLEAVFKARRTPLFLIAQKAPTTDAGTAPANSNFSESNDNAGPAPEA